MKPRKPSFHSLSMHLHMILLFAITLLCLQPTTSVPPTNLTDHLALLKFKESIDDDPHGFLSSWNDSIQFCSWHGITCGRRHQRVTTLKLEALNLRGTISPYIVNLTFLRGINLQNNSFYEEIPKEVGYLFRLQDLNLFNNMLGGEIPTSLSNCSKLRLINVSANKLFGKIPLELGTLTKLISLQVARNNFIGGIPSFLGNLSSLVNFSAAYNDLKGNIPESVGSLKSLSGFAVGNNKLNEYGVGGEASTEGDVYSYGVLVLEMFTGRRPTNDMFRDGLNLHNFVKMALPKRLVQIVDPLLLPKEATEMGAATATIMAKEKADNNDDNANEIEVEEADNNVESKQIDANMKKEH